MPMRIFVPRHLFQALIDGRGSGERGRLPARHREDEGPRAAALAADEAPEGHKDEARGARDVTAGAPNPPDGCNGGGGWGEGSGI